MQRNPRSYPITVEGVTLTVTSDLGSNTRYGEATGPRDQLEAARIELQRQGWGRYSIQPHGDTFKLEIAHTTGLNIAHL